MNSIEATHYRIRTFYVVCVRKKVSNFQLPFIFKEIFPNHQSNTRRVVLHFSNIYRDSQGVTHLFFFSRISFTKKSLNEFSFL